MAPKILVICCNWDGWSCLEAAANSALQYPASVKVMRISCLSRIHAGLILKAFEFRADGVMLVGCESDSCHFGADSEGIRREYEKAQHLLEMLGIGKERLALVQLPAFNGQQFVAEITKFSAKVARISTPKRTEKAAETALKKGR